MVNRQWADFINYDVVLNIWACDVYVPAGFITHELAGGQFTRGEGFVFPFVFRHGSILPASGAEYSRLEAAFGNTSKVSILPTPSGG